MTENVMHLHIGHHFFGSGNFGDDLMIAGFLTALKNIARTYRVTCATSHKRSSQALRFPEVDWLPYEPGIRRQAIENCDAWIGLGDTPFQLLSGEWFLTHLLEETELCRQARKPMYYLGVGVEGPEAIQHPGVRTLVDAARQFWTRDESSARLLQTVTSPDKVHSGADLANIYLKNRPIAPVDHDALGLTLIWEQMNPAQLSAVQELILRSSTKTLAWLVQDARLLSGSEMTIHRLLTPQAASRLAMRIPGYSTQSMDDILDTWGRPAVMLTCRYHAGLVGAWQGARVAVVQRSSKLSGLVEQLGLLSTPPDANADQLLHAINACHRADRTQLMNLAAAAEANVHDLLNQIR